MRDDPVPGLEEAVQLMEAAEGLDPDADLEAILEGLAAMLPVLRAQQWRDAVGRQ